MKKSGLFFGSFDPPHKGHLAIAKTVWKKFILDEIKFILTPQNPFKTHLQQTPTHHRKKMLEKSLVDLAYAKLDRIELSLPPPHYTFITLKEIKKKNPNNQLYFIMGGDSFYSLPKWEEYQWILANTILIVYQRLVENIKETLVTSKNKIIQGLKANSTEQYNIILLEQNTIPLLDISSTLIREKIALNSDGSQQEELDSFITPEVKDYIFKNGLYQKK